MPEISIIIATHNRADAIVPSLDAAAKAIRAAAPVQAEIVVVNNASCDDTASRLEEWRKTAPVPFQIIDEPVKGVSRARNAGIRAAKGDLLLFTDDDCHMDENYVRDALRYDAADTEPVMRSGSVLLGDPADLPVTIKKVPEIKSWKRPLDIIGEGELLGRALIGCNIMARRAVIDRIGPFDEKLGPGTLCRASEDTDFFYRAYLAGVRLEIVPDMIVSHFHGRRTLEEKRRLLTNYAIGNGALMAKYLFIHPNFCRHFYWNLKACFRTGLFKQQDKVSGNITAKERLFLSLKGAFLYVLSLLSPARQNA